MNLIKKLKLHIIIIICIGLISVFSCIQLCQGSYEIKPIDVYNALTDKNIWNFNTISHSILGESICNSLNISSPPEISTSSLIIWNIRLPRILVGILVGINLALAGCIFQTITQNEMASPYTLGISQGAGLSIMVTLIFFPHMTNMLPLFAMIGGIISFFIVYGIAYNHGTSPIKLVLAGIVLGAITGAIQKVLFLFLSNIETIQNATNWTLGSLIGIGWTQFKLMLPWSFLATFLLLYFNKPMDMLLLGDNTAKSLGMSIEKWRMILSIIGILLASSSVAAVGLLGFIGLIVPHVARTLLSSSHKNLFTACIFIGPTFVIIADTISRLLFNPIQLPIGVVTGALGGLFFLFLMKKKRNITKL